jgi:hypothetical protein
MPKGPRGCDVWGEGRMGVEPAAVLEEAGIVKHDQRPLQQQAF